MSVSARTDCPNCGAAVPRDAWFCQRCGNPLEHDVVEPGEEPVPVAGEDPWTLVRFWGTRIAAAALIVVAAASVLFAVLVLVFGAFVESGD